MQILDIALVLIILLYSAVLHEIAHGLIAYRLGDPTAKILGRLTLNPIKHLDLVYSFLIPLMLFISNLPIIGGAKPVPVDPFNLKEGFKDYALISLAGPMTNLLLAAIASAAGQLLFPGLSFFELAETNLFGRILYFMIQINLSLGIFNLLPIPPLDGSKIFALLLPERTAASYLALGNGPLGLFILVALFYLPGLSLGTVLGNLIVTVRGLLGY